MAKILRTIPSRIPYDWLLHPHSGDGRKTPQGNTEDSCAEDPVPYSTTRDSNTPRLSGLPEEIKEEANSLKTGKGKGGQLPHSHG